MEYQTYQEINAEKSINLPNSYQNLCVIGIKFVSLREN